MAKPRSMSRNHFSLSRGNPVLAGAVLIGLLAFFFAQGAAAATVRLTFVLICDIYQMNESGGRGGLARIAAVLKAERAASDRVVVAHAGDAISPSLMSGRDRGAHMIDLLNDLPIDVFVPGNHEFDFGPEVFMQRMGEARFPILAANLAGADAKPLPGIRAHALLDLGGVKVGVIGLTAEDSVTKSQPGDLKFQDSVATAERLARQLRQDGADLVVLVAHARRATDRALIAGRSADLILSGDDHDLQLGYDGKTAFAEAMQDGFYVVAVDLDVTVEERGGRRRVVWWPRFRVIDTADATPDAPMAARVAVYEAMLAKELDVVIGRVETEMASSFAVVRSGEAALGNLFADALRDMTGADVALLNGGGFRANKTYPAGAAVSRRDILSELPFGNLALVLRLTGAQLRAALEQGFAKAEDLTGGFPQVSGMSVRADVTRPPAERVVAIAVGGKPIEPQARYTVATNDFLAQGGDGYAALRGAEVVVGPTDAKLLANHVMAYIGASKNLAPRIEGRVVVARDKPAQ